MEKFIGGVVVGWGRLISVAEQEDMYGMEMRVKNFSTIGDTNFGFIQYHYYHCYLR